MAKGKKHGFMVKGTSEKHEKKHKGGKKKHKGGKRKGKK